MTPTTAAASPVLAIQRLSEGLAEDVKKVIVQVCPPGRVLMLGATSKRVRELLAHKPVQVAVRVVNDCWLKSVVTGLVQLQGWCSVVTLDLKNFYIPWKAHGLAQALGQCSSLTKLHLRFQGLELFDKEFFELLGQGLGQCSFLADLNIECNCPSLGSIHFPAVVFARNLARFLVCVLRRCSASLTKLHLSSSSIESEGATCLAEVLGQCQSLKGLNLSMNQIWASQARGLGVRGA